MVSVDPTHYLTHLIGTVMCCPRGHQAGSILVKHAHYLTHLVGTVVCCPRGHQAGSILVEHAHQLPRPAGIVVRRLRGQCGAHSLLDPPGWDRCALTAWSVWSPLIT